MSDRAASNPGEGTTRRNWVLKILAGAIGVTGGALLYPVVRFLWPREVTSSGATSVKAPYSASQLRLNEKGEWPSPFDFGGQPCLLILTAEGTKKQANGIRLQSEDVRAFNAVCTHTDCTVQYEPEQKRIFCACHLGVYDLNGVCTDGPPPRPLESYKVDVRGEAGKEEIFVSRT
ncbi:MAG: ubiquinol-cytochrome c reductase iron-sulfur subunit [Planctomycetes bacterium]|nr:ubiquinol-cytochrome c reductase iron-sulfur subunit [Planctomycetota bacterium]